MTTRVLVITTNYPRWEGDPHSPWLVTLLHQLRDHDLEFHILAPSYTGLKSHSIDGIPVHRYRYAPARWEILTHEEGAPHKIRRSPWLLFWLIPYLVSGCWAAWKLARTHKFHIVHVHWPVPQGVLGLVAQSVCQGRLVGTYHGAGLVLARRFPWVQPFLRAFSRRCDGVSVNSTFTGQTLTAMTGVIPAIIPFGVTVPIVPPAARPEPGLILSVGRLIPRKGMHHLVRAMALLPRRANAHLVIVGDGPERPQLTALIQELGLAEQITLAGRVSDQERDALYARCVLFVLPAVVDESGDTEMLGMVLLEAMGYGRPVIASQVGGVTDIVRDGESGLLVPAGDPEALAQAMSRLLLEPTLAATLGQAGLAFAQDNFSWDSVVAKTLALYQLS